VHALSILRPGQPLERREVAAPIRAGGSNADDIRLPACPPSALRLAPVAAGVVVEAIACGLRVGGRPVPPGGRRLLRPGERAELHGAILHLEPDPGGSTTRAAACALLRDAAAGEPLAEGAHLVVLSGPAAGARHALRPEQTIGRGRRAVIALPDPNASRVHARLRLGPEGASIEDLGSKNGVRVNGVRIERRPFAVRPRDELLIGETAVAIEVGSSAEPGGEPEREPTPRGRQPRPPHLAVAALLALSAAALALAAS
jgi:hypothetical protein